MASDAERAALVALVRLGQQPLNAYANLAETGGSAISLLHRSQPAQGSLLPQEQRDVGDLMRDAAEDIARWEVEGIRLLTVLDESYPPNLRGVHDRPPLIFVAGDPANLNSRAIAVIGTRRPSSDAIATAQAIAAHLVGLGYTVASGLAAGIDTAAHVAALDSGGRTIAVIGTGIRRSYPSQNAALQRRIAHEGVVVSRFWPDASPTRQSFPMRNAVMSGLTLGTVVVEASERSGARIQARFALAQGRPVFLLEGLLQHEWARELATRQAVHVVRSAEEVASRLETLAAPGDLVR